MDGREVRKLGRQVTSAVEFWSIGHPHSKLPKTDIFTGAGGVCVLEIDQLLPSMGDGLDFGLRGIEWENCGGKG